MTVLVTGASGFVGRHLVQTLLANGAEVRAMYRRYPPHSEHGGAVQACCGDLEDPGSLAFALKGVSVVYHLAAVVPGAGDARTMWRTNLYGTARLAEACVRAGVQKLVLSSSVAVYRPPLPDVVDESFTLGGIDAYGASKAAAESAARTLCRGSLQLVIIRPCQAYGPMDGTGYTRRLLRWLDAPILPSAGRAGLCFSLVHVSDVVQALCAAGEARGVDGLAMNVAAEQRVSLVQLGEALAKMRGCSRPNRTLPLPSAVLRAALVARRAVRSGVGAAAAAARAGSTHGSMLLGGPTYDITRARTMLGYAPRVSAEQGVSELLGISSPHPSVCRD